MRKKSRARRLSRCEPTVLNTSLTVNQYWDLQIGDGGVPAFPRERERREAWERHRDSLLAGGNLGTRPVAYWDYEDIPTALRGGPDDDDASWRRLQRARWLMDHGELRVGERAQLERDLVTFTEDLAEEEREP